jgi:HK97 family phage major capsid protein/HK97 family phage prohead protease
MAKQQQLKGSYEEKVLASIDSVKEIDGDSDDLIIEGFANTIVKDRAGDIIPASTWSKADALQNYLKNPIILAYHNHSMPIGTMVEHSIEPMGLRIRAKISKGAGNVYQLIKDHVLKTFSVGFMIKDANYDPETDTFYITDVELTEVSVVSVPCNQDSTFSVSKSLRDSMRQQLSTKEKTQMSTKENKTSTPDVSNDEAIQKAVAAALAAQKAADAKAAEELKAAEAAKAARKAEMKEAAKELRDELQASLKTSTEAFQAKVNESQEEIKRLQEELQEVVASRSAVTSAVKAGITGAADNAELAKQADAAVIIASVKEVALDKTKYFSKIKAVNESSSIQVSSESYETIFSTNLIRDIQAALVVAPLFTEMMIDAAQITIPINPNRQNANWVAAAAMADGSNKARTGAEIEVALTERTLKTFKLAAKSYLTEETDEDTIQALVPILRQHLVEAHANETDRAFLVGDGSGKPAGLVKKAVDASAVLTSAAKADGSVKVTAKGLASARRLMGLYGINVSELAIIISQDAYWDLILDDEWADVQQVTAANATKLTGEVGNVYGMPVLVSNNFEAKAAGSAYGVVVNKGNFVVPRQRGVTLRSDFDVELDRRVFVATQRLNLEALIEGKGVAAITYAA